MGPKCADPAQEVVIECCGRRGPAEDPGIDVMVRLFEQALEPREVLIAQGLQTCVGKAAQNQVGFTKAPAPGAEADPVQTLRVHEGMRRYRARRKTPPEPRA